MTRRKPYRVGRSPTGLGLFANETIAKGADIVTYTGRRIRTKLAREIERRRGNKYLFEINERWTIDGSSRKNMARYVNHACRPNAEAVLSRGRMVYRAVDLIPAGTEITVDYGDEYVDLYFKNACRCASCRD